MIFIFSISSLYVCLVLLYTNAVMPCVLIFDALDNAKLSYSFVSEKEDIVGLFAVHKSH